MSLLTTITETANDAHLRFLIAGGHAVIAHGYARTTFDVDLIVPRGDRDPWLRLANGLGYTLHHEGSTFVQLNPDAGDGMPLDLMLVNPETFEKLVADSVPAPTGVPRARVVSLRNLLALKCHAIKHGHPGRIVKDADDVLNLLQINRVDLNEPEVRDIFLKHGTSEFYEKAKRICSTV